MDSGTADTSGFIVQMTDILALPDREGCSILVNLEFRNGTWSLVRTLVSQPIRSNSLQKYYLLPLAAFSAKVEITLPNVSKLYKIRAVSVGLVSRVCSSWGTNLVLMYLPSLVRSLSEVAFSEPARSIKLCMWASDGGTNGIRRTHQHRRLNTSAIPTLQLRSSRSLGSESGSHPSCRCHPPAGATVVIPPG